jgi:hypothetical protein
MISDFGVKGQVMSAHDKPGPIPSTKSPHPKFMIVLKVETAILKPSACPQQVILLFQIARRESRSL